MFAQNKAEPIVEKTPKRLVWGFPALCILLTLLFGTSGTYIHLSIQPDYADLSAYTLVIESVFTSIGFLVLNSGPFPSDSSTALILVFLGRLFGLLFVLSTALLILFFFLKQRLQQLEIELTHKLSTIFSDSSAARHTLVCGLTDDSTKLVLRLRNEGKRVVVLEENATPTAIRRVREAGAWVLHGPLDDSDALVSRGKVHLADEVFVASEDNDVAVSIVQSLYEVVDSSENGIAGSDRPLRCYLNLPPSGIRNYLHQYVGTSSGFKSLMGERDVLELHTYHRSTATAREILKQHPPDPPSHTGGNSIHILLIGWSPINREIITQLCYLLHVEQSYTRRLTVVTENPEEKRRELFCEFPCLDSSNFPEGRQKEFIKSLFPEINFIGLPTQPERLLSDGSELTKLFEKGQHLTVVFGVEQRLQTGYLVSGIVPRLDHYVTKLDMHTEVLYYESAQSELSIKDGIGTDVLERVSLTSFREFYDGVTPTAVRGTCRDRPAKQLALYHFLKHDYASNDTPAYLNERTSEMVDGLNNADGEVTSMWDELNSNQRTELADLHWNALSEHYRNTNRYAADHAPFKHRLAERLRQRSTTDSMEAGHDNTVVDSTLVDEIAKVEHQRWCAEKLLNGWEPLPKQRWSDWSDDTMQQKLRSQRYHRDICPINDLIESEPEEFQKDIEQVQFVLNMLQLEESKT